MSLYQVLEYHMEFLEAFGAFGAQKKCLKRSTDEQRTRATSPERRREVAVTHIPATLRGRSLFHGETTQNEARSDLSERPTEVAPEVRSDLLERHTKVARVLSSGDTKVEHPGATPQSDLPRSLPARATSSSRSRFDGARHEEASGATSWERVC
ncbi:hypothetical protein YC2023_097758 [Brassica napus]